MVKFGVKICKLCESELGYYYFKIYTHSNNKTLGNIRIWMK